MCYAKVFRILRDIFFLTDGFVKNQGNSRHYLWVLHITWVYNSVGNKPSLYAFFDLVKSFDSHTPTCMSWVFVQKLFIRKKTDCWFVYILNKFMMAKFRAPQGTVLDSLPFVIYINDLFSLNSGGYIVS